MGMLVEGQWSDVWFDTKSTGGRFVRQNSSFRNWITPDGQPGPSGEGGFAAQAGRYHLYVSLACPWAHRTLIMRNLKGLAPMVSVSSVHWLMLEYGWTFAEGPGVIPDDINGVDYLYQLYQLADPKYTGRATVPILWDKQRRTVVSNESSEIIRMFNSAFDQVGALEGDYYPAAHRDVIDELNQLVYEAVNNGVYRAGFATSKTAYEEAVIPLFSALDWLELRLSSRRFLLGDRFSEADIRLFTTLVRFDAVYVDHFRCNLKRLADYPHLSGYLRDIFHMEGIKQTVDFEHIRRHYYESHRTLNPSGIVPDGLPLDFTRAPADSSRIEFAKVPG
ncbi:glutathione S-transferase family protein [Silvimonas amylolytica]|nr:glutathione S-transferase family protein [Silvimonas amylolytica]